MKRYLSKSRPMLFILMTSFMESINVVQIEVFDVVTKNAEKVRRSLCACSLPAYCCKLCNLHEFLLKVIFATYFRVMNSSLAFDEGLESKLLL
jgi:hypothetical protein